MHATDWMQATAMAQATTVTPVTMTARMTAIHECSQQQECKQLQEYRHQELKSFRGNLPKNPQNGEKFVENRKKRVKLPHLEILHSQV